jgi:hypothetical protein
MLKELKSFHREVARLSFEGYAPHDIATRLHIPVSRVNTLLKDQLCQAYLQRLYDKADSHVIDVRKKLASLVVKAIDCQEQILTKYSEKAVPFNVVASVAKDVLDRNGYAAPTKVEHFHGHFTKNDLKELMEQAKAHGANISTETKEQVTPFLLGNDHGLYDADIIEDDLDDLPIEVEVTEL